MGDAPFAVLADLSPDQRAGALQQGLDLIAEVDDDHLRAALAQAAVDLAAIRLHPDIIKATWEDSAMPIPSLLNETYEEGRASGRVEGREEMVAAMLRHRFGPDAQVAVVARRLASLTPDELLERLEAATGLDDLA